MCASRRPAVGSSDWLDAWRDPALRLRNSGLVTSANSIPAPTPPMNVGVDTHECCQLLGEVDRRTSVKTLDASMRRLPMTQTDRSQRDAPRYFGVNGAKSNRAERPAAIAHRTAW